MSKELEALNYVWYNYYTEELSQDEVEQIEKHLNIVQDGLKRLEAIDNAKPSEALECLGRITKCIAILDLRENGKDECNYLEEMKKIGSSNDVQIIKQNLIKAQKQDKVLEIIKEKDVNFEVFGAFETYKDYEIYYNNKFHLIENKLTEEEFDLLKRYLDNEH